MLNDLPKNEKKKRTSKTNNQLKNFDKRYFKKGSCLVNEEEKQN